MRADRTKSISNSKGELALIERIRERAARSRTSGEVRLGIGDDCALLALKDDEDAAITTDLSLENRHFRLDLHPPESVGHRTLTRGLSDIAAMGARPVAVFLSLGLPRKLTDRHGRKSAWIDRFMDGLMSLAARQKTSLAGGDLAESPIALADIVVVGAVPRGQSLLRSGARPGDLLYVSGALGGSAAGLRKLGTLNARTRVRRISQPEFSAHLWPEPRISQALWLLSHHAATAAIDISDGLSTDIDHLCTESHVSAEIDANLLPIFPGATLEDALHGGEDYELLFTARPGTRIPRAIRGVRATQIGTIVEPWAKRPRVVLVDGSGRHPLLRKGWEHFRAGERVSY
jgi:thiamine-monophosphate kinase